MKPGSLDQWRSYFRSTPDPSDIFEVIEKAILVAAADSPKDFRSRRDRIAELLFSPCSCSGCHPDDDDGVDRVASSKGSKVVGSNPGGFGDDNDDDQPQDDDDDDDAEVLTDEIEEVSKVVGEVLRIKNILLNSADESESVLYDCLRRLELMALTVDTLQATEIGKAVNRMRKHGSEEIRRLARLLIDGWKDLVDEWYSASQAIRALDEGTPESVNPSTIDDEEEGLPSPPLDFGALFATQPAGMEWSQFFDGMDDDGNPRNSRELNKKRESGRSSLPDNQNSRRKPHPTNDSDILAKERMTQQLKEVAPAKPNKKHSNTISGPGRSLKPNAAPKVKSDFQLQEKNDKSAAQQKLLGSQQQKLECSKDVSVQRKLEATKRKLQESYQQAENAKKQRTIKVMELHDLPKQRGPVKDNMHVRSGNFNRNRMHGRS